MYKVYSLTNSNLKKKLDYVKNSKKDYYLKLFNYNGKIL